MSYWVQRQRWNGSLPEGGLWEARLPTSLPVPIPQAWVSLSPSASDLTTPAPGLHQGVPDCRGGRLVKTPLSQLHNALQLTRRASPCSILICSCLVMGRKGIIISIFSHMEETLQPSPLPLCLR